MQTLVTVASVVGRHAFALAVMIGSACVLWTVSYFALLLWAMVVGGGIGSPILFPLGFLGILVGGVILWLLLLFPSTLIAELLCRWRSWPTLLGIPLAVASFIALSLLWSWVAHLVWPSEQPAVLTNALVLALLLSVPLGLYWWVAEFPGVVRDVIRFVASFWKKQNSSTSKAERESRSSGSVQSNNS